jgi:hypothetical protein
LTTKFRKCAFSFRYVYRLIGRWIILVLREGITASSLQAAPENGPLSLIGVWWGAVMVAHWRGYTLIGTWWRRHRSMVIYVYYRPESDEREWRVECQKS